MANPETYASSAAAAAPQSSPWQSPVPYLFGGLAAMLGLIAFALLILACSYWKLSREQVNGGESDDVEGAAAAEKGDGSSGAKDLPAFEEKFLVIMAGDVKPTFLATPTAGRASSSSSFNDEKINGKDKNQNQTLENGGESQVSRLNQERTPT